MPKIQFYFHDKTPALDERKRLKQFIIALFGIEKRELETLSFIFCSDEHLLGINIEFLKHDFYTDVITFDLSTDKSKTLGEAYISVDRVRENAKKADVSFNNELHRVIFHASLHLCGYKDKKNMDIVLMRKKENEYLELYFS